MTEIRCVKCNRLLFKGIEFCGTIEVKCSKCGYIQVVNGKRLYPTVEEKRIKQELKVKFGLTI